MSEKILEQKKIDTEKIKRIEREKVGYQKKIDKTKIEKIENEKKTS